MKIHVVVDQGNTDYQFDFDCERVPLLGEELVNRDTSYTVNRVMTFYKENTGYPTLLVTRRDIDDTEKMMLNNIENHIR